SNWAGSLAGTEAPVGTFSAGHHVIKSLCWPLLSTLLAAPGHAAEKPTFALWEGAQIAALLDPSTIRNIQLGTEFEVIAGRDVALLTRDGALYDAKAHKIIYAGQHIDSIAA